eukprot:CAMPEP_0179266328 /NCGR_PEP_ID=MMETSP0797-20121207/29360_1 /TAXON_ID=47934 /ORGANISM="Dinophysis acuminata, Strain DAEP01" /LENGTH=249 /DNA_ID=CAMNT_0020974559 /DNA_START=53 /DNA_END=798 /DNA_ORIENTATION=-
MAANLINRLRMRSDNTLAQELRRATESGVIAIPRELFRAVHEAMQTEDDRREVMRHIRGALCEPSGKKWQRVHAGLALVEDLVKNGTPVLRSEIADGLHFDLVQRVSFLEAFQHTGDKRAESMVRNKAKVLRADLLQLLQGAGGQSPQAKGALSPRATSVISCSTTASTPSAESGAGPAAPSAAGGPRGDQVMILNGVVAVGHNDDTTSESSGGEEGAAPRAVAYRRRRRSARQPPEQGRGAGCAGPAR